MLEVELATRLGALELDVAFATPGGVTALFGRSGTGKTTIVNCVAGLLRPERGRIVLGGLPLLDTAHGIDVPRHRRRVGYVFQDARLFPHLTVRRNLLYGRWFAERHHRRGSLDEVVGLLGIEPLLGRRPGLLSGGERQRVAIGRALLAGPRLLLLDEAIRRKQTEIDEAAKLLESQSQLIENQRVADIRRERQFAEYAETIEKLKVRADEIAAQVVGFVQLREEIKRELAVLPDFQERLEVRVNELFEIQRDAEERVKRTADSFRDVLEKEWKTFAALQEEKWHSRDQRIAEYEPRVTDLEEELPKLQPQIGPLYEILDAFSKAYANAGREWLAEANVLLDKAKVNVPSEVKPSRRQRRKQQALVEASIAPAEDGANGVDMNADLVE